MSRATATSTLYRNRDGSYSRLVYTAPVNYRTADGTWQPIKTSAATATRPAAPRDRQLDVASASPTATSEPQACLVGFGAGRSVSYGLAERSPVTGLLVPAGSTPPGHGSRETRARR